MTPYVKRVLAPIRVEAIPPNYNTWEVFDTFEYRLGSPDGAEFVRIEKGFITDFGSTPRPLWWLWPPSQGRPLAGFLVHDCLYKTGYVLNRHTGEKRFIERDEADAIMRDVMQVCGVSAFSTRAIHRGVRIGGMFAWNRHRKADDDARTTAA